MTICVENSVQNLNMQLVFSFGLSRCHAVCVSKSQPSLLQKSGFARAGSEAVWLGVQFFSVLQVCVT